MKISIMIPAWNEKGNIDVLAKRFHKLFTLNNINYELVFVLRGTKEESGYNDLVKLVHYINVLPVYADDIKGYAASSKAGFSLLAHDTDYVVTMDGDQNHAPEELLNFLNHKEDIIIGSRYLNNTHRVGPLWKRFLSRAMNKILTIMFGLNIKDKTSGYRMYKKKTLDDIWPKSKMEGFEFLPELLMIANKDGYTMKEVPISFSPRVHGESKMNVMKTIKGYLKLFKSRIF